ncbi:hypothetical protein B0H21DRAFT_720119 [Amylocystis lapponica]|nr:hypothetical protein B0H21DRAFT_720119 [Amylocystis lapponica]
MSLLLALFIRESVLSSSHPRPDSTLRHAAPHVQWDRTYRNKHHDTIRCGSRKGGSDSKSGLADCTLNVYTGGLQSIFYPSAFHADSHDSDNTCQANAWEWIDDLSGEVKKYIDEKLNDFTASLGISHEIQLYKATTEAMVSSAQFEVVQQLDADIKAQNASVPAAEFPAPETALGHDKRVAMMSDIMTRARGIVLRVGVEHGVAEESLTKHLDILCPQIVNVIILVGDFAEQHSELVEVLLLAGSILVIPEQALLRPFLAVFGFGPYGPVKGSVAAWAQRVFFGAAVPKESWFGHLQRAAMKFGPWWKWTFEWVKGQLGVAGSLFAQCE